MAAPDIAPGPSEPRIVVIRTDDTALHLYRSVTDMLRDADVAPGGPLEFYDANGGRLEPEYKSWRVIALRPTGDQVDHAVLVERFGNVLEHVRTKIEPPMERAADCGPTPGVPEVHEGNLAETLAALWTDFGHSSLEPPPSVGNPLHNLFCH
jgi:hypothetical protein